MNMKESAMFVIVRSVFLVWLLSRCFPVESKTTVIVKNGLEGREELLFHCKSADNDLGVQDLHYNETFRWRFGVNIFQTTLFHCTFAWEGASHKFVIYKATRDHYICDFCSWIVKEEGPCMVFTHNLNCYNWYS